MKNNITSGDENHLCGASLRQISHKISETLNLTIYNVVELASLYHV